MCSSVSVTPQTWHVPRTSAESMWDQKSPTLNTLCMHFQKKSLDNRWSVVDRTDLQIISSDGVYPEISLTEHLIRSRFINVDFRCGVECSMCIALVKKVCEPCDKSTPGFSNIRSSSVSTWTVRTCVFVMTAAWLSFTFSIRFLSALTPKD
jgi:hypothetical protein